MSSKKNLERQRLLKRIADKRASLENRTDIKIKIPRISLPSDYNIQSQPLFSLPPELMKPILASSYPGYKKAMAQAEKRAAEQEKKLKSYTALRKQREEFRKRLVDLITRKDDEMDIGPEDIPSAGERELLRYYYYIRHGVDTIHVAPLDQKLLDKVLLLIPTRLKKWRDTLIQGVEDMREDFMMAIKKAIVDFVLRDPAFVESLEDEFDSPQRKEIIEQGPSWEISHNLSKLKLERHLHLINPCLAQLLDLWYVNFRNFRLVNCKALKEHQGAFELNTFQWVINKQIEYAHSVLIGSYYDSVVDIFLSGSKKNKLPNPAFPKRLQKFYDACAAIMTHQMQNYV